MNIKYILSLLALTLFISPLMASQNILVGIWASPNKQNADTLWYFFSGGKVSVSTNAGFSNIKASLNKSNKNFEMAGGEKSISHEWHGTINNAFINSELSYDFKGVKGNDKWTAEKISNNPNKKIDFYSVCSDKNSNVWKVKNTGKFESCPSWLPIVKTSSFSRSKANILCKEIAAKRQKEKYNDSCDITK